jgi:hypothetical protein
MTMRIRGKLANILIYGKWNIGLYISQEMNMVVIIEHLRYLSMTSSKGPEKRRTACQ